MESELLLDNITPEQINLKSFVPKKELNPKIWFGEELNYKVRLRLLDIADDFYNTLGVPWVEPEDIVFIGSLAGYNWSKYSDIDLHIIVDFSQVDDNVELVRRFFESKKNEWNNEHENILIYGYPVEVYVQDINDPNASNGVYSLERNEWVKKPVQKKEKMDRIEIKREAAKLINRIDRLEKAIDAASDEYQLSKYGNAVKKLYDGIRKGRKQGIKEEGEMSTRNIVFKLLRRSGHLDKLYYLKGKTYDLLNTIR